MKILARGFTLLEILVVLLLMGIATSVVMISIPSGSGSIDRMRDECAKYARSFAFISEHSMIEGITVGVYITPKEMWVLRRQHKEEVEDDGFSDDLITTIIKTYDKSYEDQEWAEYKIPDLSSHFVFPDNVEITLSVGGLSYETSKPMFESDSEDDDSLDEKDLDMSTSFDTKLKPQVYFYPSMEITPFDLSFLVREEDGTTQEFIISVRENGSVKLKEGQDDEEPQSF